MQAVRIFLKALLFCCCTLTAAQAQGWKGIVPLHSTRADVERLLGPGGGECQCHYDLEGDHVTFDYAKAPCKGNPSGWNVPADTVLGVYVRPQQERQFSTLGLDESKYEKDYDDSSHIYYSNRDEGVQYSVLRWSGPNGIENVISTIHYVPSSKDVRLRCPCFPPEDDSIFKSRPMDEFSGFSYEDSLARLDNFAIQLLQVPQWKGYVIVYAEKQTSPASAKSYVRRYIKYLTKTRGVPAERVSAMYGGYKEQLTVELYAFRDDMPPPKPQPSYVPCDRLNK